MQIHKKSPQIFGILNITPDSFSDGGKFFQEKDALNQAENLIKNGAQFLDIGGESTRPGAPEISPEEEWERIKKPLKVLTEKFSGKISLDTRHPQTAEKFAKSSPLPPILNSVTGFQNPHLIEIAAKYQTICIINHFPGNTPTEVHTKEIDSIHQVQDELLQKAEKLKSCGILEKNIILDPGIGFGKTTTLNWQLLEFKKYTENFPAYIGHSKKRFLSDQDAFQKAFPKTKQKSILHSLEILSLRERIGKDFFDRTKSPINILAAQIAIKSGAEFLRVHNPEWYIDKTENSC